MTIFKERRSKDRHVYIRPRGVGRVKPGKESQDTYDFRVFVCLFVQKDTDCDQLPIKVTKVWSLVPLKIDNKKV